MELHAASVTELIEQRRSAPDWFRVDEVVDLLTELVGEIGDVGEIGRTAYELFVGEPPSNGATDVAAIRPEVPLPLADLIRDCLADDPGERPTCVEILDFLHALPRRRAPPRRATAPQRASMLRPG